MRLGMGLGLGNLLSGQPLTGFPNDFSFNFDGSNDYLETSTINEEFKTVSFWFKPDSTINYSTSGKSLCGFGGNNFNLFIGAGFGVLTNEIITLQDGSNYHYYASTSLEFSNTSWTHLAVVWNASSSKYQFYVNGVLKDTTSHGSGVGLQSNNPIIVGARSSKAEFFDGEIDEFSIWNESLSSDDISKICSKPVDLSKASTYATDRTSNLKLWLRAGDKVLPESDASIARSDFYTDFDGLDDHIELGSITSSNPLSLNGSHGSVIFWVNIPDVSAGDDHKRIIDKSDAGSAGKGYAITIRTDGSINAYIAGGSMITSDAGEITDAEWFHIVWKWDGTNHKLYKNGIEIKSASSSTTPPSDTANMAIGSWNHDVARELNGSLSSVSVYQTALDAQTIKQFAKSRYTPMRDNRFSVVDFDGSDDYIAVPDNDSLDIGTGNVTVSAWLKPADLDSNHTILDKRGSSELGINFTVHSSDRFFFQIGDGTNLYYDYAGTACTLGQWHHVCAVWNPNTTYAKFYLDGVDVGRQFETTNANVGNSDNTSELRIGKASDGYTAYNFDGSISSVSLYNVEKSAEEVYAIYQQGITYDESSLSGLVGYWRMGDDTSKAYPTIADSSSNSNDGTMTSMASDDIVQQMVAGYDMGAFESSSEELGGDFARAVVADNWYAYSNMTVNTITGGVSIVAPTTASGVAVSPNGAFIHFRGGTFSGENQLTTKDLEIGKIYSVTFNAFYSGGASGVYADIYNSSESVFSDEFTTTSTSYTIVFEAKNATTGLLRFQQIKLDNTVYITDITVKEVLQSADLSDTYPAIIDVNEPVLGVNIVDNNVAARWIAEGTNSDADITNGVRLTFGNNATGNYAVINDALLSTSGLTVGKIYKTTFTASYSGGSSAPSVRLNDGTNNYDNVITTTATEYEVYFNANSADGAYLQIINQVTSNVTDLINWEIKEVQGNVGTMTQMDGVSNLVYSSVLPDQSFLATGVNSAYNFIDLDGGDQHLTFDASGFPNLTPYTITAWFKSTDIDQTQAIVLWGDQASYERRSMIIYNGGNGSDWTLVASTNGDNPQGSTTLVENQIYHGAVVVNPSTKAYKIYLDGNLDGSGTFSNSLVAWGDGNAGLIGKSNYGEYFEGNIYSASVWSKELSASEISAIHAQGRHYNLLDSYSDNLVGYWAMSSLDSKTGLSDSISTIYDRSGNSNHGNPQNADAGDLASSPNAEPNGYSKGETNRSNNTP